MTPQQGVAVIALLLGTAACGSDEGGKGGSDGTTTRPAPVANLKPVPTDKATLYPYLLNQQYNDFGKESAIHPSTGPHASVRVFFNEVLAVSLAAGNAEHPVGAAAIKENYDGKNQLIGWAVSVKVGPASNGGVGWYWFENLSVTDVNQPVADGNGDSTNSKNCTNCHQAGNDFVLSAHPLR